MDSKKEQMREIEEKSDVIVEETMRQLYEELDQKEKKVKGEAQVKEEKQVKEDKQEEQVKEDKPEKKVKKKKKKAKKSGDTEEKDKELELIAEVDSVKPKESKKTDSKEPKEVVAEPEEELEEPKKKGNSKKIVKRVFLVLGILLILAYCGVSIYFMNHFYLYTEINGVDFSTSTVAQVENYMKKQVDDYTLKLLESDGKEETINGDDIDIEFHDQGEVEALLKEQNPFLWVSALWKKPVIESPIGVLYDEKKLDNVISKLDCKVKETQVPSQSATPVVEGDKFVVKKEVIGTELDDKAFEEAVKLAIDGFWPELDMVENQCYVLPKYLEDDKAVHDAAAEMTEYLGAEITYDVTPNTEVVNAEVIGQWITVDENMKVTFEDNKVREYVQNLAAKYNTYGVTRQFVTGFGNTVEVSGGNYGWYIDQEAEYNQLLQEVKGKQKITREPIYTSKALTHEGNDFGNTYVEVDLTNQVLFYFQDGQCMVQTNIVTGNPGMGNATPQGVYTIAYKTKGAVLRGPKKEDGTYEWESPVSFWMPFNGGIGLHDAPWRGSFGGSIYSYNGSHGCVNMPYTAAEQVFGYVQSGTPVVCHY